MLVKLTAGAVSTTGIGEALLRSTTAHQIALAMGKGDSPDQVNMFINVSKSSFLGPNPLYLFIIPILQSLEIDVIYGRPCRLYWIGFYFFLAKAIAESLSKMTERVGGDGGAIAISKNGEIGIEFNSRCQFHQCSMSFFYTHRSQKHKKTANFQSFCAFGI